MCNACGFSCCAWDGFSGCGCDDCDCPECWRCFICDKVGHTSDECYEPDGDDDFAHEHFDPEHEG